MSSAKAEPSLVRHIGLGHGTALYLSAILGAGVLVLPGQVASLAGPASLVSWGLACVMGAPLAWMFASLARSLPDAGGITTYVGAAWGQRLGRLTGWLYFAAGSVGQTIVPLTGGYYVARALHDGDRTAFVAAGVILAVAVFANTLGLKIGSGIQLLLAASIALALVISIAVAVPAMSTDRLTPFAPYGIAPIGEGVVVLFFAFAGWEAVAHLAGEFKNPGRDLPRAVASVIVIVTVLYMGLAAAVVLTGTYGSDGVDHVAVGRLLQRGLGGGSDSAAALVAVVVSLATTNAFVAGVSRLAYSLARSQWLPRVSGHVSRQNVPVGGVLTVGLVAAVGLVLAAWRGWGTETLVVVPSTLVVTVYLVAASAGVKLLTGLGRLSAVLTIVLTLVVVPTAAGHFYVPLIVAVVALVSHALVRLGSRDSATPGQPDTSSVETDVDADALSDSSRQAARRDGLD